MKYRDLKNKGNDHQLQEAPDCQTNSLSQYHRKCKENTEENNSIDLPLVPDYLQSRSRVWILYRASSSCEYFRCLPRK